LSQAPQEAAEHLLLLLVERAEQFGLMFVVYARHLVQAAGARRCDKQPVPAAAIPEHTAFDQAALAQRHDASTQMRGKGAKAPRGFPLAQAAGVSHQVEDLRVGKRHIERGQARG
jgi:hypothetical protein